MGYVLWPSNRDGMKCELKCGRLKTILFGYFCLGISSITEGVEMGHLHLRLSQVDGLVEHIYSLVQIASVKKSQVFF